MTSRDLPARFRTIVGPLPEPGRLPESEEYPFETVRPVRDGFIERGGVKSWFAVWGESGPFIAFAPVYQVSHTQALKAVVPYLSRHFRVVTMDARGNGRSDRPENAEAYTFDEYYADFVAVLDAAEAERVAIIGFSATAMTALRFAAEHPERATHLIITGGFAESLLASPQIAEALRVQGERMRGDWPGHLDWFFSTLFTEPHSTKAFEDGVRHAWASTAGVMVHCRDGWFGVDVREHARRVTCPTLIIHGDADRRVPHAAGEAIHALIPGSRMLTVGGGGHVTAARDPVFLNRTVRDFVDGGPKKSKWVRAMSRKPRALFISSAIGLGHVQRDLAIARELRALRPDLEIDWFTSNPASAYLEREGERVHPIASRLASENRHLEHLCGEHDLPAFFALRTMDEVMTKNFMTFVDLVEAEHYDVVIGDEAFDVDYYYHENPELKRQPFVFLTDFVGCLPQPKEGEDDERETFLCADRNAEDLEHIARFPYLRDRAIFIGNPDDVPDAPFGPGLPGIREWTDRNFVYSGYTLPFDPAKLADTEAVRARLGYRKDEKIVIASAGGTGVGGALLGKVAQAYPRMKREVAGLRMILVAGPRVDRALLPDIDGLEVKPYVHNLHEHLACCDLALVQGGLTTCMELVATRRPFLGFPLQRHFEQNVHVRKRLANYDADRSVDYHAVTADGLAERALAAMHAPVRYRPVETDGARRAAQRIADVIGNRTWLRR
jgi:pimeloyl-ACP methyl ester carboxylesterase/predicted glycosyltransferase